MILLSDLMLPLDTDFKSLKNIAAKALKTDYNNIISSSLHRKSIDARKKDNVQFCCSLVVEVKAKEQEFIKRFRNASLWKPTDFAFPLASPIKPQPVIVGFGPAGMFAGLTLARAGLKPIILERGNDADTRKHDVETFWNGGKLNTESNVQFGEGGAGTFSDGKLNSGIKDPLCRTVLKEFADHGASDAILTDAKPHIGTDILISVVKNIRKEIESLGGEVIFGACLKEIFSNNNQISGISFSKNGVLKTIDCLKLILAIGHSARDTFGYLDSIGITMSRKPFAMGVRIEHLQKDINLSQYGSMFFESPYLPAADYKLAAHLPDGRGVYTFCMCPGGVVVNAASENNSYVTNGMSYSDRAGVNANSAVLVNILPSDFSNDDLFAGIKLQELIEKSAYAATAGCGLPAETFGDFLKGNAPSGFGKVYPSVRPVATPADINKVLPQFISESLKQGIVQFGRKLKGFDHPEAVITAPETRSSCPVRILRSESMQSSLSGLFPAGEGAGYAGGIMSAATDGIRSALALIDSL